MLSTWETSSPILAKLPWPERRAYPSSLARVLGERPSLSGNGCMRSPQITAFEGINHDTFGTTSNATLEDVMGRIGHYSTLGTFVEPLQASNVETSGEVNPVIIGGLQAPSTFAISHDAAENIPEWIPDTWNLNQMEDAIQAADNYYGVHRPLQWECSLPFHQQNQAPVGW